MNPIYCRECRTHIPRDVSMQGKGICPECILRHEQAKAVRDAQIAAQMAQDANIAAAKQALQPAPKTNSHVPFLLVILGIIMILGIITIPNAIVNAQKQAIQEQQSAELNAAIEHEANRINPADAQMLKDSQSSNRADQLQILQLYNHYKDNPSPYMNMTPKDLIEIYDSSKSPR